MGLIGSAVKGLFRLGLAPVVFVSVALAVNLLLGTVLGFLAGVGVAEAASVGFVPVAVVSGSCGLLATGWFVS